MSQILVVDDLPSNRYLLRSILEAKGYGVSEASNGADALEMMRQSPPQLIISDILMPQMDGFVFCRRCKAEPAFCHIPFIFFTATYTDDRDRDLAAKLGVHCFLTKPFEQATLLSSVQQALHTQHSPLPSTNNPPPEETVFFRLYNEALVRKLEEKMLALEQSLHALEQSEHRFEWMVQHTADLIVVLDSQDTIRYASPACQRIFGCTPDAMVGTRLSAHIHPEDRPLLEKHLRTGWPYEDASPYFFELRGLGSNGRIVDIEAVGSPLANSPELHAHLADARLANSPELHARIVNIRDISERTRQDKLLRYQSSILRSIQESVIVTDLFGAITYWNQGATAIFGYTQDEMLAQTPALLYPDQDPHALAADLRQVLEGKDYVGRWKSKTKAGQTVWVDIKTSLMLDIYGKPTGFIGVAKDVTEQALSEESLRKRLIEMEAVSVLSCHLRQAQTIESILPVLLEQSLSALELDTGFVLLTQPPPTDFCVTAKGWPASIKISKAQLSEGITGAVFRTGKPHKTTEIVSDPLLYKPFQEITPEGWGGLFIPIRTSTTTIGILSVCAPSTREFTHEEERLLLSLAEITGTAIQRLSLHQETKTRLQQLQSLQRIDQSIASSLDLRVTLQILLEQAIAHLGVDAAGVLLLQPKSVVLAHAASRGIDSHLYGQARIRLGEGIAGKAALERHPNICHDLRVEPGFIRKSLLSEKQIVGYAVLPLLAKGQIKGVLEIFHRQPFYPAPDGWSFLEALAGQAAIAIDNAQLFDNLQRSNTELILAYDTTIEGWSHALDLRDKETEGHTRRVTDMTLRLARSIGMTEEELVHVRRGALLHDIGKLGVPDAILHKAGPLTPDEWVIMRQHTQFAYDMLWPITYLRPAIDIPFCHHEKWDGTGYPRGLEGEQIPLAARLFAVVDVWDALRSDRPYRKGWELERILEYIRSLDGTHFDPQAVATFFEVVSNPHNEPHPNHPELLSRHAPLSSI
ncbi:PAS domain S-box protein [Myxococcota bacterium]|nr:PAS domain S-box protein [Myxococcota bacterium]